MLTLLTHLSVRFRRDQEGASMVEYGLLVALIAIAAITALEILGDGVIDIFTRSGNELTGTPTTP